MNDKKKEPAVNDSAQEEVHVKEKTEKNNNCKDDIEINEADDKLIGDDLEIKQAEQHYGDRETALANEGNNY